MSFLGGSECSTAANPLAQVTKHVQDDKSLQRDRLVGRGPGGMQEGMRSRGIMGGQDPMMDEFLAQGDQFSQGPAAAAAAAHHQPFAMDQMRHELAKINGPIPGQAPWAAEFDPQEQARMEAAFPQSTMQQPGFSSAEFAHFQQHHPAAATAAAPGVAPAATAAPIASMYQRPMGMGYSGMGMMGMMRPAMAPMAMQQQPEGQMDKGKGRMVELDDQNWEAQFAELDAAGQKSLDDEANAAMEAELDDIDRSVHDYTAGNLDNMAQYERVWKRMQAETLALKSNRKLAEGELDLDNVNTGNVNDWEGFDDSLAHGSLEGPRFGIYIFEEENAFKHVSNPFEEGLKIMKENGNLSLAALAFEAAVQKDANHVEAWVMLGSAQAQNEKETPAIRAMEHALEIDPDNLDALMGLAVSYTNEGYDSNAYRSLERWLSSKYPQIIDPSQVSDRDADISFTDRQILHEKVTDHFIKAAQLSPQGEHMDPDVQVGLGILFYGAEEYEKAVDCFSAALASTESGTVNQQDQLHLLWNRLGATLANSGRPEEAIEAYEKALAINPSFVRARYNLGVSCINIGCYPEAAQHLLGALAMHKVAEQEGKDKAREIVDGQIGDAELENMIRIGQNQSSNLYDTLRRVFSKMGRKDLADQVVVGMDVTPFRKEFDF
ncbi:Peroxisomal membrane signal receptor PTS1 [Ascosphaera aggregata]|nr:Peroxisomal membrane signal receptor PTS1 [Ascosphaera aggregata]